ncbi:MAG: GNAT family N-acetyltransferase [Planctomycetes bacterium]|nr:GNAT family N-acetyltransferase [Planctomycetota bacterium]
MARRESIVTERLLLRDIREEDAEFLVDLDADPEVMRHIGVFPPTPVEDVRERIREVYCPWQEHPWRGLWLVFDRESDDFLGWVFVRPALQAWFADQIGWDDPRAIEIGYRFRRLAWGRGIATEAARPLLSRALADPATSAVLGCAQKSNVASIRVLEKLGLEHEGEAFLDGKDEPTLKLRRPATGARS